MGASRHATMGSTSHHGSRSRVKPIHVLSVSAAVTRLSWRPPAFPFSRHDGDMATADPHDGMLAIASAPIKGRAGGNGLLSLWSHHRPFMPLSVCEGHSDGAVTDFVWLDTPRESTKKLTSVQRKLTERASDHSRQNEQGSQRGESVGRAIITRGSSTIKRLHTDSDDGYIDIETDEDFDEGEARLSGNVWQHVLSVGRDGRCLLQSFARGERPIQRVPPSCFALANLSPFQHGYGSLQVFSVHQKVPSGRADDFLLTGLRRDAVTTSAEGVFREAPLSLDEEEKKVDDPEFPVAGVRHPGRSFSLFV